MGRTPKLAQRVIFAGLILLVSGMGLQCKPASLLAQGALTPDMLGERVDLRTNNAKVFQRADGSGYAVVYSQPVYYQLADGSWATIANSSTLAATVNTGLSKDAYAQSGAPAIATGNQFNLYLGYDTLYAKYRTRIFAHFNLPTLPVGATVTNARAYFYQYVLESSNSYTTYACRVTQDWGEQTLTWNNQPSVTDCLGAVTVNAAVGWKNWPITSHVQAWYAGTPNYGFRLHTQDENAAGGVYCSNQGWNDTCQNGAVIPYVVIDYQIAAPAAPSNLSATTASVDQINLSWQDNSNSEDGFKIERSPTGSSNWTQVATVGTNVTSFQNTGLPCGTTYYYRVRAYNTGGDSSYSGTAYASTVVCAPSNLGAIATSATQINLSWMDNSNNETGFRIERSLTGSSNWAQIATVGASVTTYQNTGLTCSTAYYYRVQAYNAGSSSSYSNTASAATVLCAPSGLSATAASASQINLTWTDNSSNENGFKIERSPTGSGSWAQIATVGVNITSYQNTGLSCGIAYYYRVRAYNSGGDSGYSGTASATTTICAPSGLSATTASVSQINLSWADNSNNETGFRIERSLTGSSNWAQIATVGASVTTYQNTGLTCSTAYYYRVQAYNASSISSYSSTASATTVVCAPGGLNATTVSANQINLTWQDNSSNEDGFKIERSLSGTEGWTQIITVGANVTSYPSAGLSCGTAYYYRVRAYNAGGYSSYSGTASATTVICAPSSLGATATSAAQINLSWADNSNNETGFRIERSLTGSSNWAQIATVGASVTTYQNTGLTCSTAYYYRVQAYNASSISSYSSTASATTVVCAPGGLNATTVSANQINLTWRDNSSNEDGFKIERSLSGTEGWAQIITVGANVTSYPSTGLSCGTAYYYRVRAYNAGGYSSYSNNASAMTVVCPPTAPSNPQSVSVSASQLNLTWQDNSNNEDGFKIERSAVGDSGWTQIAAVGINVTTYQDTGLTCGDRYSYRVRAYNTGGHSEYSSITSSSVLPCAPTLDVIINISDGGVFPVSWQPVAGALGYALQEASASDFSGASVVYSGAATSTVMTGKAPGLYYYRVRAFNSAGVSIWSNVQTILIASPDLYEPDNTCTQARTTLPDGMIQEHTFHRYADEDWVVFEAIAGANYRIDAQIPPASLADVELEVYDQCTGAPLDGQGYAFAPGVVLEFTSPISGAIYLRWTNTDPVVFGESVGYHISVRDLSQETFHGAVVIVAGREKSNDILQPNIHYAANQVYQLFQAHGYPPERIYYLATDSTLPGFNALPTEDNLRTALTTWALERVNAERPLTLYLIDHGNPNMVYLDRPAGESVTPAQIDTWLTQLETARPGVRVNVIVEACNSGSFIELPQTVSKSGRVVITSTGPRNLAYASSQGAMFSDYFLEALWQGQSLYQAFQSARWATQDAFPHQSPWLDDNGNSIPNEDLDGQEAALRGFAYAGTLSGVQWPPHIVQASGPDVIAQGQGIISAEVRDDEQVMRVWAVVYPPSYIPPETGEELVSETLTPVPLTPLESDQFAVTYTGFTEIGVYRIVLYAEDNGGRMARPKALEVRSGWRVYLPVLIRQ